MARILNDKNALEEYEPWLLLAKKSYSEKLWNGKYYNYDSSPSRHHDCIMSDQLAGFWYLRLCGLKYEVKFIFRKIKNKKKNFFFKRILKKIELIVYLIQYLT
jgi:non-lysosomal glucosylceramidase